MNEHQRLTVLQAVATEVASESVVHADALYRREVRQDRDSQAGVESLSSLTHRVSGAAVDEIDRAIFELQSMRDMVRTEGERVEREIKNYGSMSQTAVAATKAVAEGLAHWRSAISQVRHDPIQQELS